MYAFAFSYKYEIGLSDKELFQSNRNKVKNELATYKQTNNQQGISVRRGATILSTMTLGILPLSINDFQHQESHSINYTQHNNTLCNVTLHK